MKKLTLTTLSLLLAGFTFGEEKMQKRLVIGKIVPGKEKFDPGEKRPHSNTEKPKRPLHKPFPPHWGKPPALQTKDLRPLPVGFGMGSSTLAHWITNNIKEDLKNKDRPGRPKRPEPSEEIKAKLNAVRLVQNDLVIARKLLLETLKDKSKEDVAELIKQFKDTQKEKHQELKAARKDLAREVRDRVQTGDRRE